MKIRQKLVAALVILLIRVGFSALDVKAEDLSEGVNCSAEIETIQDTVSSSELSPAQAPGDSAPMFSAYIEYTSQGYVVKGVYTEFSSDLSSVRPMYSLDGEYWQICAPELEWDLHWMNMEGEEALGKLQTQTCLYGNYEPFSSYLAGELDRFCLKLRLTREDGSTYDTQVAIIERGDPQPLPQDFNAIPKFHRSVFVSEMRSRSNYGRYQLTVSADATAEDIAALLPDTLPIEIQFLKDNVYVTGGVVDCPVTWKNIILPQLTAGDIVTILDAAEEIVIPGGTLVNTPLGIFQLDQPLGINEYPLTDEVRLVLNVVSEDEGPAGVLVYDRDGMKMAFDLKPTGATAIHVYTFSEGSSGWMELSGVSLLEAVNAHPSAANSGYALIMGNDSELLQGYLAAIAAGEESSPFYVGLKIEGGVYDGRQLVLAWPDTYHAIPPLPNIGGTGGNEGNAGADNKGDSTEEGQRPNLPQDPEETPGDQLGQSQDPAEAPEDQPGQTQDPAGAPEDQPGQSQDIPGAPGDQPGQSQDIPGAPGTQPGQSQDSAEVPEAQPDQSQDAAEVPGDQPDQSQDAAEVSEDEWGGQRSDLLRDSEDGPKGGEPKPQTKTDAKTDIHLLEKTDSNTQISTQTTIRKWFISILLMTVIAISISGIYLIIAVGRKNTGRKF